MPLRNGCCHQPHTSCALWMCSGSNSHRNFLSFWKAQPCHQGPSQGWCGIPEHTNSQYWLGCDSSVPSMLCGPIAPDKSHSPSWGGCRPAASGTISLSPLTALGVQQWRGSPETLSKCFWPLQASKYSILCGGVNQLRDFSHLILKGLTANLWATSILQPSL